MSAPQNKTIPKSRQREAPGGNLKHIGQNMKRVEDPRLLVGEGEYIDDFKLPNMLHAAALGSPHAHARIKSIDVSKALSLPGVHAVMTGKDVAETCGPLPCFSNPPVIQRCVALDRLRHVGEPVAIVAADSRYVAEDAIGLIEVEYEPLPVMSDPEAALQARGDGVLHPERGDTNVALKRKFTFGPVADDFANADIVVKRNLRWPRSGAQPIETCGAVSDYNRGSGKFTVHCNTSMYNYVGWLWAVTLGVPAHKLNIVPTLAGGSFGSKLFLHKVPIIASVLARHTGRPVKYIEDRLDNMTACDHHGSDRIYHCELALDKERNMIALRCDVIDDYGAYFQFGVGHHGNALSQITGPYTIRSVEVNLTAVLTNKCQQGAYRGFGSEVSNFALERMVDAACDELSLDPVEFRAQNFIKKEAFPYFIPTGNLYDSGDYHAVLAKAKKMLDYDGWRKKQEEARKQGRYIGIGVATCQERSVFSSTEFWSLTHEPGFALTSSAEGVSVKIDPTGNALITLQAPFWGDSPGTMATLSLAEQV
jgi:CO/xanthine dehydrogenase Mo-binding subunit